jgi:hypothetical protein
MKDYDAIIIGSGQGGGPLAFNLHDVELACHRLVPSLRLAFSCSGAVERGMRNLFLARAPERSGQFTR